MNKLLIASAVVGLLAGCAKTNDPPKSMSLFNGLDLDNWVIENDGQFSVEDGVIKVDRGTGWLRSADVFSDFTLLMEFRFQEAEANSGIFVRTGPTSNDDENGWPNNGYQVQCMDIITGKAPLATLIPYGAPPFKPKSDLDALAKAYKPLGEWQTYEITCAGETLEVKLNDIRITTATSIKNLTGHIGIQGEHGLVEFRKIELIQGVSK